MLTFNFSIFGQKRDEQTIDMSKVSLELKINNFQKGMCDVEYSLKNDGEPFLLCWLEYVLDNSFNLDFEVDLSLDTTLTDSLRQVLLFDYCTNNIIQSKIIIENERGNFSDPNFYDKRNLSIHKQTFGDVVPMYSTFYMRGEVKLFTKEFLNNYKVNRGKEKIRVHYFYKKNDECDMPIKEFIISSNWVDIPVWSRD